MYLVCRILCLIKSNVYQAQCLETTTHLTKGYYYYCYCCYPHLRVCVVDLGCEFVN